MVAHSGDTSRFGITEEVATAPSPQPTTGGSWRLRRPLPAFEPGRGQQARHYRGARSPTTPPPTSRCCLTCLSDDLIEYSIGDGEVIATYTPASQKPPGCE